MEKILLVEPNYKNKYPPIGLMKLSTYFKGKGDFVEFHKGLLTVNETKNFDKVYVTTLFTFDFKMCIDAIKYYITILGMDNVFVGGIAASIMPDNFTNEIPNLKILQGQLTSSKMLGYNDDINIDALELDYDILYDTSYEYEMSDSYFIHTTRGCPRKCSFCAVKDLEPVFLDCRNITPQILEVDRKFGVKKRLLIMDNNILFSKQLNYSINEIYNLGFGNDNNVIKKANNMKFYLISLAQRIREDRKYNNLLHRIKDEFLNLKFARISKKDAVFMQRVVNIIKCGGQIEIIEFIFSNQKAIEAFFDKYNYHKISRYVDFNQGLDARLFTEEKARNLSVLNIRPCRIAFDDLDTKDSYFNAMTYCINNDITHFSNYLLYNFKERPEDLWNRLYLNIRFCKDNPNINLFSFPMKYAAIDQTDRNYIGHFWNKKYLRAMNVILNVTKGVVAKEEDFFIRAFGENEEEFIEILSMPDEFIRYRDYFDELKLSDIWRSQYRLLSSKEKEELIFIVSNADSLLSILDVKNYNSKIQNILHFYTMKKKDAKAYSLLYFGNLAINT